MALFRVVFLQAFVSLGVFFRANVPSGVLSRHGLSTSFSWGMVLDQGFCSGMISHQYSATFFFFYP